MVLVLSFGAVYGIGYGLVRLAAVVTPIPEWVRPALAWGLLQVYLVVGLLVAGDLPGAAEPLRRLTLLAGGASLLLGGLNGLLSRRDRPGQRVPAWVVAGLIPWLLALGLEAFI